MALERVIAQLSCTDEAVSLPWYAMLFGRPADTSPMAGLHLWLHGTGGGFQLFREDEAGTGTLVLVVQDLDQDHRRLSDAGLAPGPITVGQQIRFVQLADPDGNRVILSQPD